ncbi:MAG: ABC transporter permease [Candidatus Eremiobacteraeota bacterium]|nr:ABC transporter permease [Candidatus Eremiobacteraeota bacterium]
MIDALISGLISGNTYALIALGLSLIFGVADLINFAHGSVFALGAMLGWYFLSELHWPFGPALAAVIVATGLLGIAIERIAVRPLMNAPRIAALLSTVAVALILDRCSELLFTPETRLFPSVIPHGNFRVGDIRFGYLDLAILAVSVASVVVLALFLKYTKTGRALRATAQDRDAARQMGTNVGTMQSLAFAISAALAGVGGVLVGMYYRNVEPNMAFNAGIEGFAAAALGGLGNLPGAVAGGLLLGVLESYGVTFFGGATRQFITFAVLILVFWFRPGGIFGTTAPTSIEPLTTTFFGVGKALRLRARELSILAVLAVVVLPLVGNDYVLRVASLVAIFALLALSLTLVAGTCGLISIGQGGLLAAGAYASALLTRDHHWPFWLALPAAGLVAALLGAVLVTPVLRLRGHYVAIATLAVGALIVAAILNLEAITYGPLGITNIPPPVFFGRAIVAPRDYYLLALAVLLVVVAAIVRLQHSHLGRAWRAIREDEIAAASSGIGLSSHKSLVFMLGAFVAGIAGSLLAHQYTYVSPDIFGVQISILALTIVVLGGMANVYGAILGALVLVGGPELFRPLQDVRILAYGLLLLLLIRFRPQGLFA